MHLWEHYTPELVTDLYQLTMAESYLREGLDGEATFSVFIRDYPDRRAYYVAAGLEHVLELVSRLTFSQDSLEFIASLGRFSPVLLNYLRSFRFTGTLRALPEGRIFFAHEPILEVTAPIVQAQLLETLILNVVHLETLIAGKAARCIHAARGRRVIDFALRRTHGVDAGVRVARSSYLAGFSGTSNVLAGKLHGIPLFGTMAHSYITSFPGEKEAFQAFARAFPENTVLLIDTYDTVQGARNALEVARSMAAEGRELRGVRLDSGDLVHLSRQVRQIFVEGGFPAVPIMASGNLDEDRIRDLLEAGAEIDVFAVGTRMGVSADAPYLDISYKLVELDGRPILKLSSGKKNWVGRKQIYRTYDSQGRMSSDRLCSFEEKDPNAEALLMTVMENGKRTAPPEPLLTLRNRFVREFELLPEDLRQIDPERRFPVQISEALAARQKEAEAGVLQRVSAGGRTK